MSSTTIYNGPALSEFKVKSTANSSSELVQSVLIDHPQTVLFASIAAASSGANSIVAASATKKIRVLRFSFSSAGTVNAKWQSASTDLTGLYYEVSNTGISEAYCPVGIFETAVNEALNLNLSGNVAVGGSITYILV